MKRIDDIYSNDKSLSATQRYYLRHKDEIKLKSRLYKQKHLNDPELAMVYFERQRKYIANRKAKRIRIKSNKMAEIRKIAAAIAKLKSTDETEI